MFLMEYIGDHLNRMDGFIGKKIGTLDNYISVKNVLKGEEFSSELASLDVVSSKLDEYFKVLDSQVLVYNYQLYLESLKIKEKLTVMKERLEDFRFKIKSEKSIYINEVQLKVQEL